MTASLTATCVQMSQRAGEHRSQRAARIQDELLGVHQAGCWLVIQGSMWLAATIDDHRRSLPRRVKRWQKCLRQLYQRWLRWRGLVEPPAFPRRRCPWNRTPDHIEEQVVRLHVEQPTLGAGQLRWLAQRVLGFSCARETIRQILIRRRELVVALEDEHRKKPRRIVIGEPRKLWGADLTLVWVLGIVPVWLFGVVEYHGSRLVCFERMQGWPTAVQVAAAFERAVGEHGAPARLLTDRAPIFRAEAFARALEAHGTKHARIKPCHAWTNGRIERVFRTFKETVFRDCGLWLFRSTAQIDRFCADFLVFYNGHRGHSAYRGRTPDEVHAGRDPTTGCTERIAFFDGRLLWWRFT
jgi:transposase InsO family protein